MNVGRRLRARRLRSAAGSINSGRHILESRCAERCANDAFLTSFRATLIRFLFSIFAQYLLYFNPGCSGLCSFTWAAARSQLLLFVVLAGGFGVSLRVATSISPLPRIPQSPLKQTCAPRFRKHMHTRPSTFYNPILSANKHVVQICRSSQSAAVQTVQVERRTSPFNGIESSLSRAVRVVIKTKSLPISATTFPTALSLYIAHDGRKNKHNPILSANKHVVQICRSSLSAAADGLADGSGER